MTVAEAMSDRPPGTGAPMVRALEVADSDAIAALLVRLAEETPYVLLSPRESRAAAAAQPARTAALLASPNQQVFVAGTTPELAGFVALTQGAFEKNAHVASLMIGVRRAHWGHKVGHALMDAGLRWASQRSIWRIELGVMAGNTRALAFYEGYGFLREGVKRAALMIDGEARDELLLARVDAG